MAAIPRNYLVKATGHLVPDHDKLAEMLKYKRDSWPKSIVWTQSDYVLKRFYWLEALEPVNDGHIEATVDHNKITIKTDKQTKLALWLDQDLVDLKRPILVEFASESKSTRTFKLQTSMETYCLGLERTADPRLAAPVRIEVFNNDSSAKTAR